MMTLKEKLDVHYDPTDADKSMQVALKAVSLMRHAVRASLSQANGLRIGRDTAMFLQAEVMELGRALGILSWNATAQERDEFVKQLTDMVPTREQDPHDEQIEQAAKGIVGIVATCMVWGAKPERSVELCGDRIRELLGRPRRYPE